MDSLKRIIKILFENAPHDDLYYVVDVIDQAGEKLNLWDKVDMTTNQSLMYNPVEKLHLLICRDVPIEHQSTVLRLFLPYIDLDQIVYKLNKEKIDIFFVDRVVNFEILKFNAQFNLDPTR